MAIRALDVSRMPVPVVALGVLAGLQSLALLAGGLTRLDGVLAGPIRPEGWVVVLLLALLAGWVVGSAGTVAGVVEGSGRRALVVFASVEIVALATLFTAATVTPLLPELPNGLPIPAAGLLALAVPVGKLLLMDTAGARAWLAAGPRPRQRRPDPVATHRLLCTLTLAGIGLGLAAVAVLVPASAAHGGDVASVVRER